MGISLAPKSWRAGFEAARAASLLSNAKMDSKKMGAALYSKNNLISVGYNLYEKTHPLYTGIDKNGNSFCRNTHAELMAITRRKHYDNSSLTIYVYRETINGEPANSQPCKICRKLIKEFGIKKIRYIDEYTNFREERL